MIFLNTGDAPDEDGEYYDPSEFDTLFLDGLTCDDEEEGRCLLQNVDTEGMGGLYEAP